MPGRWVTFDCYGTIVDWNAGLAAVLAEVFGDEPREALIAGFNDAERRVKHADGYRRYREVLAASVRDMAAARGREVDDAEADVLARRWGTIAPFADAGTGLGALRERGFQLAILTNCDDDLFALTHRSFLLPFDIVVTAEQVRDYKPSPAHFRRFAALAKPDDWVHVACSWYHDIVPAKALGVKRVWLDREGTGEDPAAASSRVTSAQDVAAAIARLA